MKQHPPKVRFVGYDAEASRSHEIIYRCDRVQDLQGDYRPRPEIGSRQGGRRRHSLLRPLREPLTVIFGPRLDSSDAFKRRVRFHRRL